MRSYFISIIQIFFFEARKSTSERHLEFHIRTKCQNIVEEKRRLYSLFLRVVAKAKRSNKERLLLSLNLVENLFHTGKTEVFKVSWLSSYISHLPKIVDSSAMQKYFIFYFTHLICLWRIRLNYISNYLFVECTFLNNHFLTLIEQC